MVIGNERAASVGVSSDTLGSIVLIRPISFMVLSAFAVSAAVALIAFFVWGTYTKRTTVLGQLMPDVGMIKVYAPQPGVVQEIKFVEGQQLHKGDPLYIISSERSSQMMGETQARISVEVVARRNSLRNELAKTQLLERKETRALRDKVSSLQSELVAVNTLIGDQERRLALAESTRTRYQDLASHGYVSEDQYNDKDADAIDQGARLHSLNREAITVKRELDDQQSTLAAIGLKYGTQVEQLERQVADSNESLSESEAKRRLVITSPETGVATAVLGRVGQAVDSSRPLVSVIPVRATLQAQLYAVSRDIGFIKVGDTVQLRYQAYPYQKFGHYRGTVAALTQTSLTSEELAGAQSLAEALTPNTRGNEPIYMITVNLSSQTVEAYGQMHHLRAGMLVEGDILMETRRLYEWVLEPLFSLSGKF